MMVILALGYFINISARYILVIFIPNNALGIIEKDVIIIVIVVAVSLVMIKIFGKKKPSTAPHTV